jgi:hypothetical protein
MESITPLCTELILLSRSDPTILTQLEQSLKALLDELRSNLELQSTAPVDDSTTPDLKPVARRKRFEYRKTRAYKVVHDHSGMDLRLPVMVGIAKLMTRNPSIQGKLDHDDKRYKNLLYDWLEINIDVLVATLPNVVLCDEEGEEIYKQSAS